MVPGALSCALFVLACGGDELLLPDEGAPATLTIAQGDGQTGVAGAPLPEPIVVRVLDTRDRPVAGAQVVFAASADGGTVTPEAVTTDGEGLASSQWALGSRAGAQAVDVAVSGARPPLAVRFTATASAGAANGLTIVAGQGQAAQVGTDLPEPLVVRVTDQGDNPVSGVSVSWAPSGGGSVNPAASTTDADGRASTTRTLGPVAGTQTTVASAPSVGAPVTFTHTATSGPASRVLVVSGDNQSAPAGSRLPASLVVRVLDAGDNPVVNRAVTWVIGQGGGSADPVTSNTAPDGTASTAWTLGPQAGANTITAVVSGVGSAGFSATGRSAAAARLLKNGGDGQTAPAQTRLGSPLSVRAVDANGNGVGGVTVAWAVTAGGGSLSASSTSTRSDGTTEVTWTLGSALGTQTASASASGLQGSPVGFTATATIGPASRLAIVTQPSSSAPSGESFAQQPVIELRDAAGNTVPQSGVQVTAAIVSGGGTLGGTVNRTTDAAGRASYTDLAISGSPGDRTLIFAADGFSSVTSSVIRIEPGAPSGSASTLSANPTSFEAGSGSSTITVTVRDAQGTPLSGVAVEILVSGTGNTITQPASTDASGVATGSFTSSVAETKTVSATAAGVAIQETATVTVSAPAPS